MTALLKIITRTVPLRMKKRLREKAENARWKSEDMFKILIEAMPDIVYFKDSCGRNMIVNKAYEELLGIKREDVLGKTDDKLFPLKLTETCRKSDEEAKKNGRPVSFEEQAIDIKGRKIVFDTIKVPIHDDNGKLIGLAGISRDITERKKAEEHLKEITNRKSKFTSMVSHELRTPLTAIIGGIDQVLEGFTGKMNEKQQYFLGVAKRNVDRLHRLATDVLDFTRLESGGFRFKMQEDDVNRIIKDVVEMQKPAAKRTGLYLKTELAPNAGKTVFDPDKIIQVLTNLINNAIKFTENGGITVKSIRNEAENAVRIHVKDTGIGIEEKDIPKLFHEFQQADGGRNRKIGGTGLGLAISREIIEAHGGRIWVESRYGIGSDFIFALPIKTNHNEGPAGKIKELSGNWN